MQQLDCSPPQKKTTKNWYRQWFQMRRTTSKTKRPKMKRKSTSKKVEISDIGGLTYTGKAISVVSILTCAVLCASRVSIQLASRESHSSASCVCPTFVNICNQNVNSSESSASNVVLLCALCVWVYVGGGVSGRGSLNSGTSGYTMWNIIGQWID